MVPLQTVSIGAACDRSAGALILCADAEVVPPDTDGVTQAQPETDLSVGATSAFGFPKQTFWMNAESFDATGLKDPATWPRTCDREVLPGSSHGRPTFGTLTASVSARARMLGPHDHCEPSLVPPVPAIVL